VAAFECRLDGLPTQVCISPWVLDDLAVGPHELAVAAVDAGGFDDLTPATFEWTVNASGPQPTLMSAPSDPSFDRSARFVFSGPAGASFECSLDGVEFEVCNSPYVVDQLGYGAHEFRVRVSVGGETGTAVAHRWTLRNAVPVALDQVVLTVVDTPREVVVDADDSDDLSYLIEVEPRNGTLEGTAPNLVYVPFDGFIGFDSFSFVANDGQATSLPGAVGIYVGTASVPSVALTRDVLANDPTNVDPLMFTAVFDQDVTGFGPDDVEVAGTADLAGVRVEVTATATPDTYRIAAVDQLRTYAEILGLPIEVAASPREAAEACARLGEVDVILIDTAGRSQNDCMKLSELRAFLAAAAPDETHLVLSATAGARTLAREAEAFGQLGVDRLALTKLDEAAAFGTLVSLVAAFGKPLSFLTHGQEVPDHIEEARGTRLATLLLASGDGVRDLRSPMSR